ncbi:rhodanese-like domain-containing protein [Ornithinimicrobium sp. Arc0846-15]|uniref:rhodanese-like domain-containing protein n=1 Tax=Ornithinimicrobium sp. INDO-MA30-4 TaxID=2908651 RepID=UPI001C672D31|nr:rhodanese-like domain-containing protein [Ornithinimicrobium sp. INDO-MA30-4]MBW8172842.1 rhodanese-like domain-containing protein [Ornithinimicrobium laminariae]UJH69867.1 rhodanese-like domain-containing protein [Ornithinimicrobium sp. INDO-MA30-4]
MTDVKNVDVSSLADDAVVIDVRSREEWDQGHAPNAVFTPIEDLPTALGNVPVGQTVPVICRSGGRSTRAVEWLNQQGLETVNVDGGMQAWDAAGKAMVSENGEDPRVG